jgi:hypothetical protein
MALMQPTSIIIQSKSFNMILNTLADKRRLADAFSKYIPQDSRYNHKYHVVATMSGFQNWAELKNLLDSPHVEQGLLGIESFWDSESPSIEEVSEGIRLWLEYMVEQQTDDEFKSYTLLKIVTLFYFVFRNDDFMVFYDEVKSLGLSELVNVPILSGFNVWTLPNPTAFKSLFTFFQEPCSFLSLDSALVVSRSLLYLSVTLEDGITLMDWATQHDGRSYINQHVYSYEHDHAYYLKLYSGAPTLLVCDDQYPEGLDSVCNGLDILYAGTKPLPFLQGDDLLILERKRQAFMASTNRL